MQAAQNQRAKLGDTHIKLLRSARAIHAPPNHPAASRLAGTGARIAIGGRALNTRAAGMEKRGGVAAFENEMKKKAGGKEGKKKEKSPQHSSRVCPIPWGSWLGCRGFPRCGALLPPRPPELGCQMAVRTRRKQKQHTHTHTKREREKHVGPRHFIIQKKQACMRT